MDRQLVRATAACVAAVAGTLAMSVGAARASEPAVLDDVATDFTAPGPDHALVSAGVGGLQSAEPGQDLPVDSGEIDLFIAQSAPVLPGDLAPGSATVLVPLDHEPASALDLD